MQAIIKELLDHEGGVCVSLILPTSYKAFGEKDKVRIMMKNGVQEIEKGLEKRCDKVVCKSMCDRLHALVDQVDLNHPPAGVGVFLTESLARLIYFPFPVEQKVILSDTFEIQDILYNLDKLMVYHTLVLSKKHTRLFKGIGNSLREVVNNEFPKAFEDPYEEDKPSYHALYTKDPSQVEDKRVEAFMREVHHAAAPHVKGYPLVLIGLDKHISRYKGAGKHPTILGEIHATHDKLPIHEINKLVWPIVAKHQEELEVALSQAIDSKMRRGEAVYGVESVLSKMNEAYEMHLVVEKDFEVEGYLDTGDGRLLLNPLDPLRYRKIPNVVEHLIERVLKRNNGKVDIVGRNVLKGYEGIVLITKF